MKNETYNCYVNILREELLPAMGCTEPISVAYAAALARDTLGDVPERVEISVSGNILKNVKGVVVPNTGGLKGIPAAAAAGIIAGVSARKLECISDVTPALLQKIKAYLDTADFAVTHANTGCIFDICVREYKGDDSASVRIEGYHTNVVHIDKNGECICDRALHDDSPCGENRALLNIKDILEFADTADLDDVREVIERQIEFNTAIAREGLARDYGAGIGKLLLKVFGDNIHNVAKATAAAGSDARMNGCGMPVVIVSGSGNQGMTASLPVIVYAEHLGADRERLIRALVVSNLVTVRLKSVIGRLSAYCGAVSAGCGAAAGVCKLLGGGTDEISHTVINALAIDSGLICDGAKSSCAAKIASAVEAGLIGMEMCFNGANFAGGDGILFDNVEDTIDTIGDLTRNGMRATDEEIIRLMIKNNKK